jgi:hypothetical protein
MNLKPKRKAKLSEFTIREYGINGGLHGHLVPVRSVPQLEAINFCGFSVFIAMGGLLSTHPCNHLQKLCIPRQAVPCSIGRRVLTFDI